MNYEAQVLSIFPLMGWNKRESNMIIVLFSLRFANYFFAICQLFCGGERAGISVRGRKKATNGQI